MGHGGMDWAQLSVELVWDSKADCEGSMLGVLEQPVMTHKTALAHQEPTSDPFHRHCALAEYRAV